MSSYHASNDNYLLRVKYWLPTARQIMSSYGASYNDYPRDWLELEWLATSSEIMNSYNM